MKTLLLQLVQAASEKEADLAIQSSFSAEQESALYTSFKPVGGGEEMILNWEKDDDAF